MGRNKYTGKYFTTTHSYGNDGALFTQSNSHYENTLSLTILISGNGVAYLEDTRREINSGDIIIFPLNQLHRLEFEESEEHDRLSLYFTSSITSLWEWDIPLTKTFSLNSKTSGTVITKKEYEKTLANTVEKISSLTDKLTHAPNSLEEIKLHLLILELIVSLYEISENKFKKATFSTIAFEDEICKYIRDNLDKKLTYTHLENALFVSRYQLSKIFREKLGTTLTEYILQKRLITVSSLVREGKSLSEAATLTGFGNYSNFYKIFKKHYGISPREFYEKK